MSRRLAVAAAAGTGIQVGAALVASRHVALDIGPATLALLRYAIGFACLLPVALRVGAWPFRGRDVAPIALLGILQFAALIALLNHALQHIPPGRAALIFATFPLLTVLIAAATGREPLTLRRVVAVLLSIAGVGLALGGGTLGGGSEIGQGDVAAFLAALCGAVASVGYGPYLKRYPTVPVSTFAMAAAVIALAPMTLAEAPLERLASLGPDKWAAILFIGLSSGIGYFLWLFALRHSDAGKVTIWLGLSPVVAGMLGAILLGDPFGPPAIAGTALVLAGLRLATRN